MSMEFNKLLAAFLVAGIIAMLTGFISSLVFPSEKPAENAYPIVVPDAPVAGGATPSAPAIAEPIEALLATADPAQGAKLSKVCASCHTFDKDGANRVGPNLFGIVGKTKAQSAGFAYSDAMKERGGTWTVSELNEFLWNPKKTIPGTKMVFVGLKKPEDRAAMVKWLQSQ